MRLEKMPGFNLPQLALWPQPWYETGSWLMHDLKINKDGNLKWFRGFTSTPDGHAKAIVYGTYEEAISIAKKFNSNIEEIVRNLSIPNSELESIKLKAEKELTKRSRLLNEEQLMLSEGIRRHVDTPRIPEKKLIVPKGCERLREPLAEILNETPYVRIARLNKYGTTLIRKGDRDWSTRARHTKKTAELFYRDRIAGAYGLNANEHWGKVKAKIREILLPKANELLKMASVKRLLSEAEASGKKVLVIGGFVFWFEENDGVGWIIKEASYSQADKENNTIWKEGKIISKNHGRIVVLPYIKGNGEFVNGHTKNAPQDGKALPRHPKEYLELPFNVLEDDLMIGLFGELKYF